MDGTLARADTEAIFARAAARARDAGLRYAGAVTPTEAHRLAGAGAARILDVRTPLEHEHVGHVPDVPLIVWPREGSSEEYEAFLDEVAARFPPREPLLIICRSGVRSHFAAELLTRAGFARAYNVLEGFEGDQGAGSNGWKARGLPWRRPPPRSSS